jgi:fucose permease
LLWLNLAQPLSFLGLALMGFSLAPVFPSLIATTPERLGLTHTANGVGFQVAGAALGGAAVPSLFGLLADTAGVEWLGPYLFVAAALQLALYEAVQRAPRPS